MTDRLQNQSQIDILEEHLGYAIDLVAGVLREVDRPPHADPLREWFRQMSIHEVFWMEARLLMEFFNKNQERTACADHFTHKRIEYPFPTVGTIDSKSLADQINDQFAHLNYDRRTSEFEKLRIPEMHLVAGALARAVKTFELNLKPAAREIWNQRKTGLQPINPDLLYPQGYGTIVKTNSTATISSFEVSGSTGRAPHPDELKGPAGYPSKTEDGD